MGLVDQHASLDGKGRSGVVERCNELLEEDETDHGLLLGNWINASEEL